MAEIISINGKNLVYGLTWITVCNPKKERAEISALLREAQATYFVRHCASEIQYGLVKHSPDVTDQAQQGALLSAALLFSNQIARASAQENSLLVQRISENKVGVILLLKGAPYLDLVLDTPELDEQLAAIQNEGHAPLVTYGNVDGYVVEKMSLEKLGTGNVSNAVLRSFKDSARRNQCLAVTATVLILSAGYVSWEWIHDEREAQAKKTGDLVQLYEDSVQRSLATANFNADTAYRTIWSAIQTREIDMAGWSLKNIRCKPTRCEEVWLLGNGSYAALKQKVTQPDAIRLLPDNVTSVITRAVGGSKAALIRSALPEKKILWASLQNQQQTMKRTNVALVFTPKEAKILGELPNEAQGTGAVSDPVAAGAIPPELMVFSGDITVSAPLGFAGEIFRHHLDSIMVGEVAVEAPGDVRNAKIQIKGNYYAKN